MSNSGRVNRHLASYPPEDRLRPDLNMKISDHDLKRNEVLSFDDGLLTIKISGHGDANGWGVLAFHERQVEIDPDGFHTVEIPPSELRELRDFITRVLEKR